MDIYLENSRKVLGGLSKHISMRLSAAGASLKEPTGGFYVMPNFNKYAEKLYDRHIQNSMQLCTKILKDTGVAVLPGSVFGRPENEYSFRMAFVDFDGEVALNALQNNNRQVNDVFLKDYCPSVIEGVEKLCTWFESL